MALASDDSGGEDTDLESTWAAPHPGSAQQRVVGWRAGASLAPADVTEILSKERRARHEYKGLKRATSQSKVQQSSDPLAGLPPTWQAFWSTVPHLDPQAAYRQFRKEQQRQAKASEQSKLATVSSGKDDDMEAVEEEARELEEDVRRKKQALAEQEKICAEWDKKLARVRSLDRDEKELSRRVSQKLTDASYWYGINEGKVRSSDIYYNYLHEDAKSTHLKKVASLRRSHALMGKQIDELKGEVMLLLKAATEAQPSSSEPLQTSERRRSGESSENQHALGSGAASSSPAGELPAP